MVLSYHCWKFSHNRNTSEKKVLLASTVLVDHLALADLLVGCATTFYVIVECRLFTLSFPLSLLDMFAGLSSIFHLAAISLERLHATLRPFRHRQLSLKVYWVAIATPWILSLSSTSMLSKFRQVSSRLFFITICLTIPLLITCFSYREFGER